MDIDHFALKCLSQPAAVCLIEIVDEIPLKPPRTGGFCHTAMPKVYALASQPAMRFALPTVPYTVRFCCPFPFSSRRCNDFTNDRVPLILKSFFPLSYRTAEYATELLHISSSPKGACFQLAQLLVRDNLFPIQQKIRNISLYIYATARSLYV